MLVDQQDGNVVSGLDVLCEGGVDLLKGGLGVHGEEVLVARGVVDLAYTGQQHPRDGVLVADDGDQRAVLVGVRHCFLLCVLCVCICV